MWGDHLMFGGLMWWFWLLMIAVIIGVVVALWRIRPDNQDHGEQDAIQILEKRFARGDISKDEFQEKKRELAHQH